LFFYLTLALSSIAFVVAATAAAAAAVALVSVHPLIHHNPSCSMSNAHRAFANTVATTTAAAAAAAVAASFPNLTPSEQREEQQP
jgi:hypothetical protein